MLTCAVRGTFTSLWALPLLLFPQHRSSLVAVQSPHYFLESAHGSALPSVRPSESAKQSGWPETVSPLEQRQGSCITSQGTCPAEARRCENVGSVSTATPEPKSDTRTQDSTPGAVSALVIFLVWSDTSSVESILEECKSGLKCTVMFFINLG